MLIMISVLTAAVLVVLVVLLAFSPGKTRPFLDDKGNVLPGSISEKNHVLINGVQQGMFIEGRDVGNPVLLFLHGGAGMPEYFLARKYPTGLERYFTVCWWERRGAGLSYSPSIPPETMTLEQMIADTIEVTKYLRKRFNKEKIFLMAHSGGSLIGIQAAARAPELYSAYIGVGQITCQLESEKLSYEYMLRKYREIGNRRMVRQLEAGRVTTAIPLPASYMKVRDQAMHGLGVGTTREMRSVISGVFLASWLCRQYTLGEKFALWRGKFFSDRLLWDRMIALDMRKAVPEAGLPVYFFHGKYDYTVSYLLARTYLENLRAPVKGFYTFENSAHSPMFEEPAKMAHIVLHDILNGVNQLADGKN